MAINQKLLALYTNFNGQHKIALVETDTDYVIASGYHEATENSGAYWEQGYYAPKAYEFAKENAYNEFALRVRNDCENSIDPLTIK